MKRVEGSPSIPGELHDWWRALLADFRTLLLRRLHSPSESDDILQEVHERLLRTPRRHDIKYPRAYIFAIAKNVLGQHQRRQKRELSTHETLSIEHSKENSHVDSITDVERQLASERVLLKAFTTLPPQMRAALFLKLSGKKTEEIAAYMRLSPHTVKMYTAQAIARISMSLQADQSAETP